MPEPSFESVHSDRLNGYHMLIAVGEAATNRSLANMFHFIKERDHRRQHQIQLEAQQFTAIMDPPHVRFQAIGNQHSLWFYLNLAAVKYRGETLKQNGQLVTWRFAYPLNLRTDTMSSDQIQKQAGLTPEVRETLAQRAKAQGALIRHLVLDFEHSPTKAFDPERSNHPGLDLQTVKALGLEMEFEAYFASLRGYENPYSLAIFVEDHSPHAPGPTPSFVPGEGIFCVFEEPTDSRRSSLNLLAMRQGQPLPKNAESAADLKSNWFNSDTADGRFVVSWRLFLRDWFIPQLKKAFGFDSAGFYDTWELHGATQKNSEKWRGFDRYTMAYQGEVKAFMTTETAADETHFSKGVIKLDGFWHHTANVVRAALGNGQWETDRHLSFRGDIYVIAGENGHLSFVPELERNPHVVGRGIQIADSWQDLFASIAGIFTDMTEDADQAIAMAAETFEKAKTDLGKQLSDSYLMPAGERLFFKNAAFDDYQNLVFDIFLKAVN